MKSDDLVKLDIPTTEIPFPEGLVDILKAFNTSQIRRRVYVYQDMYFLPRPDRDYQVSQTMLILPHPIKTLEIITVSIPSLDERWYFSHADGWGRL